MSSSGKKLGIAIAAIIIGIGIGFGIAGSNLETNDSVTISDSTVQGTSGLYGEVKIGLILPLTGDLATHGEENWEGSKLAVVDFNKYLEKLGAPWTLKMISEDSATNPVVALEKLTVLNW